MYWYLSSLDLINEIDSLSKIDRDEIKDIVI